MDEELLTKQAHNFALSEGFEGSGDQFYEYEGSLFRYVEDGRKPKSKLICNVIPRLIDSYDSAAENNPSYKYVFSIYNRRTGTTIDKTFSVKQLLNHNTFNAALLGYIPGGFFTGNKDDFSQYLMSEITRLQHDEALKSQLASTRQS